MQKFDKSIYLKWQLISKAWQSLICRRHVKKKICLRHTYSCIIRLNNISMHLNYIIGLVSYHRISLTTYLLRLDWLISIFLRWDWSPGLVNPWSGYRVFKKKIHISLLLLPLDSFITKTTTFICFKDESQVHLIFILFTEISLAQFIDNKSRDVKKKLETSITKGYSSYTISNTTGLFLNKLPIRVH